MDNASNCNKSAELLPSLIPTFKGVEARLRCCNHILHLTAQVCDMFISFFFKKSKSKKKLGESPEGDEVLVDIDDEDEEDESGDEAALEEMELDDADLADDEGHRAYTKAAVYSVREQAIVLMEEKGVYLSKRELTEACAVMPKVSGLARRVHNSGTLKETFDNLVSNDPTLDGSKRALDRRVSTRWNSDEDCLKSHLYFRRPVEQLTGLSETKLAAYRLTDSQWKLAGDLADALEVFDELSRMFSAASVPLIVDVIPAFEDLKLSLTAIRDDIQEDDGDDEDTDPDSEVSPVMRVAAQAALLMVEKYYALTWDCPIYYIAIVMCPDRKLQWFKNQAGYSQEKLKKIKKMVIEAFGEYSHSTSTPAVSQQATGSQPVSPSCSIFGVLVPG
ncbi:hypothetical protein DFP72DRAFT_813346 [Ephemerocybe angulata]|uniref:Uncharacterized protein n=1 Tax=Ephemerocybe angulata TaxID=980116 RepID=A0A8H6HVI7_9AGAR|nr:hypothetical protein DFP72DRAFT_813346 [Tulosesus angulatus]